MSPSLAICTFVAPLAAMTAGAVSPTAPADLGPASALELALTERTCSAGVYNPDPDQYDRCMSAELEALRGDFGRDLRRLAPAERKALDAACGRLNTAVTREAYLDCLNGQIVARRKRLQSTAGELPADAALPPSSSAAPPSSESSGWRGVLPIAIAILTIAAAAIALVFRKRPSPRTCDACKQPMSEAAGLCGDCRRAAAEAFRHAKEDQAAEQIAEEFRHEQEQQARAERHRAELREESERVEQAERARRNEEEQRRQQMEEETARRASQTQAPADPPQTVFDPYAILGVDAGADLASVRAAFQAAKSKYEPDAVSHLGYDVQEHYRRKAEAVARAFDMIAGTHA